MSGAAWAVRELHKTFRTAGRAAHPVLRGATLEVAPGERIGLIGPSGSGKTTLVRCGLGLERPDSGTVTVLGSDATAWTRARWRSARHEVQLLFQDPRAMLHPDLPIRALLEESAALHRPERDPAVEAREALEAVGLAERMDALPRELSGGERRRAGLARILMARPRLLVADEPTAGLDAVLKRRVLERIAGAVGPACALVLVTHDLAAVLPICDRIAVMDRGQIIEVFEPPALGGGWRPVEACTIELLAAAGLPAASPGGPAVGGGR